MENDCPTTFSWLIEPAVFQTVLKMITNKNYIKLSGDGARKLTHDD